MKLNKTMQKVVAGILTLACVVTSVTVAPKKAEAAKSHTAYLMFTDKDWTVKNMDSKYGTTKVSKPGTYTVTIKKKDLQKMGKKNPDGAQLWADGVKCQNAIVFCVDVVGLSKDLCNGGKDPKKGDKAYAKKVKKKIKASGFTIKVDGKKVKIDSKKIVCGDIEENGNFRMEIYNIWGKTLEGESTQDGSIKGNACAKGSAFKWKKSLSVTFTIKY